MIPFTPTMFEPLFKYLELFQEIPSQDNAIISQNATFRKNKGR